MKSDNNKELGSFDSIYKGVISKLFDGISDPRGMNSSYNLSDILKSGFALYSLKSPSLFSFRKRSKAEDNNLSTVYGINELPSDNGLRKALDKVCPSEIRKGFHDLFKRIRRLQILNEYRYLGKHYIVSIDGVEHFNSPSISCSHCLKRLHRDGVTAHYHSMLSAAIVHPEQREVFVLDNEPIVKQDGAQKNDCERNAFKRLITHIKQLYSKEYMIFVLDALYAGGPIIRQITANVRWRYMITIKPKGNEKLFNLFWKRDQRDQVKWYKYEDKEGKHELGYTNNIALNESHPDIRVNMLHYKVVLKNGVTRTFSWITNIKIRKSNVRKLAKTGRSRWKIENETFNTLKNQGYNFEHNFGHGQQYLCTNFAFLMMLAFVVDQIQQHSYQVFKQILIDLKTRAKLWEALRAVFKILTLNSMADAFIAIADMYNIQLE